MCVCVLKFDYIANNIIYVVKYINSEFVIYMRETWNLNPFLTNNIIYLHQCYLQCYFSFLLVLCIFKVSCNDKILKKILLFYYYVFFLFHRPLTNKIKKIYKYSIFGLCFLFFFLSSFNYFFFFFFNLTYYLINISYFVVGTERLFFLSASTLLFAIYLFLPFSFSPYINCSVSSKIN